MHMYAYVTLPTRKTCGTASHPTTVRDSFAPQTSLVLSAFHVHTAHSLPISLLQALRMTCSQLSEEDTNRSIVCPKTKKNACVATRPRLVATKTM